MKFTLPISEDLLLCHTVVLLGQWFPAFLGLRHPTEHKYLICGTQWRTHSYLL